MKKSKSSVPRFPAKFEPGPAPPVRNDGLFATAGRPEPEPPGVPAVPFVAIAVGNTKDGASLPANPGTSISRLMLTLVKWSCTKLREARAATRYYVSRTHNMV